MIKTYFIYFLTALVAFFTPIIGLIICVFFAIMFDTITGIFKAVKLGGWKSITSRGLSNIVSKMFLYISCLLLIFTIDTHLLNEFSKEFVSIDLFFTKITAILLLFIEVVSIKENIESALNSNIWALFKVTIARAKEFKNDIDELNN